MRLSEPAYIGQPPHLLPHPLAPAGDATDTDLGVALLEARVNHSALVVDLLNKARKYVRRLLPLFLVLILFSIHEGNAAARLCTSARSLHRRQWR